MPRIWGALALAAILVRAVGARPAADDLSAVLDRVGERIAEYYARAQSIVATETVRIQPETRSMSPDGLARVLEYETRIEMRPASADNPQPVATFVRQLLKVNGRPPKPAKKSDDGEDCMDTESETTEPLTVLLPAYRDDYLFSNMSSARTDGRPSTVFDLRARRVEPPVVTWKKKGCVSVDLPGRFRNRVWIDSETGDVLRLDEQLAGSFDVDIPESQQDPVRRLSSMTLQQAAVSTRYKRVTFHDPEETLILPQQSETVNAWDGGGQPRTRVTQTFSNYRRFVGESRLVTPTDR